jgi:predicted nucleic acid-binding protein
MYTGLLDTTVLIEPIPGVVDITEISIVSVIELIAGINAATDETTRTARSARLDAVLAAYDPLPVDTQVAVAYRLVDALVRSKGRRPRARLADLLIASTAIAHGLPLVTHNPADFQGLEGPLTVVTP